MSETLLKNLTKITPVTPRNGLHWASIWNSFYATFITPQPGLQNSPKFPSTGSPNSNPHHLKNSGNAKTFWSTGNFLT